MYRSSSLFNSLAALIVLMRLAMLNRDLATFYINIQKLEPIFHAATLVVSLSDSSIIKKYTLLLVGLAKAHAIRITYYLWRKAPYGKPCLRPRAETEALSQDFLCLLEALPYVLFLVNSLRSHCRTEDFAEADPPPMIFLGQLEKHAEFMP